MILSVTEVLTKKCYNPFRMVSMGPQTQKLYQVLLTLDKPLTIKQLAIELDILPTAVYRSAKPLIDLGLIEKSSKYPTIFIAKPLDESLSLFLLAQGDWFSKKFFSKQKDNLFNGKEISKSHQIKLLFIQSRDQLMTLSVGEVKKAKKSIDLLRSGHEIPADLMLALTEAKRRGVTTRMLIQDYGTENLDQICYWKKNGLLVKKTNLRYVRLMMYDSSIVYFMSYKHTRSEKDQGMKIDYTPLAVILSKTFSEWWQKASEID